MCFAQLLQAIFQGLSLTFLRCQLLQGCSCCLLTFTTMSSILVCQLQDIT